MASSLEVSPTQPPSKRWGFPRSKAPFFFWWRMTLVFGCLKFLRLSCHYYWLGTGFIIKVEARFRGWSLKEHSYHPEEFKNRVLRISEGTQHKKTMLKQQMQLYFLPGSGAQSGNLSPKNSRELESKIYGRISQEPLVWAAWLCWLLTMYSKHAY